MLRFYRPILPGALFRDRLLVSCGALVCLAVTAAIGAHAPLYPGLPAIIAPLGASAVLVFAIPASPLAQPWAVIGGNMISAAIGTAMYHLVPNVPLAAGMAVAVAIMTMSILRCLHPPGGAAALTAVIGGPAVHAAGFGFALSPVALNSAVLVVLSVAFHRLSGHTYPHRVAPPSQVLAEQHAVGFEPRDIDSAIADMHETFDIARGDLDLLLARAEAHAQARTRSKTTSGAAVSVRPTYRLRN